MTHQESESQQDPIDRPDTVSALLAAAALEFAAHGYEGTKIHRIVKRAGLTTGAVYRRFKNKDELLHAAIISRARTKRLERPAAPEGAASPQQSIAALLLRAGRLDYDLDTDTSTAMLLETFICARRVPEVARALFEAHRVWITSVEPIIEAGRAEGSIDSRVDTQALAIFFRIFGMGSMLYMASHLETPDPQAWERLLQRLIHALSTPQPDAEALL